MITGTSRLRLTLAWAAVLVAMIQTACYDGGTSTKELAVAEQRLLAAANEFARGDATPWKALASHAEDVSLFGGAGGQAQGWPAVGDRYTWAAAAFSGGSVKIVPLTRFVDKGLAVVVALEQWDVRFAKTGQIGTLKLRVTHVFRREGDSWRLVHRHADPLNTAREIDSVVHLNQ
jgi:ketosteroid isomerase-like protein